MPTGAVGVGVVALLMLCSPLLAVDNVAYRVQFVNGFGCHVVQVNLSSPTVKVTPIVSLRFPGGAESMTRMCARERPVAAVTGTFFSKATLLPVGDIVIDGRLVYFGGMGSAIAITPDNRVVIERVPYGRTQDWSPFESVLACGPLLLEAGELALAPAHERFRDAHVLGRASRTAVGLTPANKLLMVVTREQVTLWELAKIMRALGCIDAINLDGGSSTGMYYRGKAVVSPARSLVNMLAVFTAVEPGTRTCSSELACDREAIYRYRAREAYEIYMRAQVPLAQERLEDAIRLLEEAARMDHLNASYQVRLAEALARSGDAAAASVAFARAGEILLGKGLAEQALQRFCTALIHDPENRLAERGIPAAYRALGMEVQAQSAEYRMRQRELERTLVAAHTDLMAEMARQAHAAAGREPPAVTGPTLAGIQTERSYVDSQMRVRVALPVCWEFGPRTDPSALLMRHRFRPYLAHLR
ncbi:MAG: phosphodiester glycosidase family protein, partial [Armatimonadota bacterium]